MPDTAEAPVAAPATATTLITTEDRQHAMSTFDKHLPPELQEYLPGEEPNHAAPSPAPKPEEAKAEPAKEKSADEALVEAYLGVETPAPEQVEADEFEKLVSEKPTGPLKHDRYEALQTATKKAVERRDAKIKELEEKLAQVPADGVPEPVKKELDDLKGKLTTYETELERHAYRKSRRFQDRFGADEAALKSQITTAAKEYGIADDDMASIQAATGKRRSALIEELDLDGTSKADLRGLLRQQDILNEKIETAVNRSREELAAEEREQRSAKEKEEQAERERDTNVFEGALKNAEAKLAGLKPTGNPAQEAERQTAIKLARSLFSGNETTERVAEILMLGVHHQFVERIARNMAKDLKTKDALIAKLQGASPGGGTAPSTTVDESKLSDAERAMRTFDKYANQYGLA